MLHYENLLAQYAPAPINIYVSPDEETSELFYTSGSTGTPKEMLSHRALYLHALACTTVQIDPATMVDLMTIPMFHANAWGRVHASTMQGVTQVMVRRFDAAAVLRMIERYRATDMAIIQRDRRVLCCQRPAAKFVTPSGRCRVLGGGGLVTLNIFKVISLWVWEHPANQGGLAMARLKWIKEVPDNRKMASVMASGVVQDFCG